MFSYNLNFIGELLLVVSASLIGFSWANSCNINLSTDLPKFEPVILTRSNTNAQFQLFKPSGESTAVPIGTQLLLVCLGNSNVIEALQKSSLQLSCQGDNVFKDAAQKTYQLKELGCKSIPTAALQLTTQSCGGQHGYIYEAGFNYDSNEFATVFRICYDNVTENTYYTHNTINGLAINFNVKESTRRAFRADGMQFTTTATNTFYTIKNQKVRFVNLFGANQPYITDNMFLARGHLTPDADFVFSYEQLSTYFYANVAPEFQAVNAGNWLRVESLARKLAIALADDLDSYNGYIDILQLPKLNSNELISIYLDEKERIEAPKYYFKVLKHEATDAAIVFITLNNPFANAAEAEASVFCTNVCQDAGVDFDYFTDATKGYTFCCELSDFQNFYAELPSTLSASKLLKQTDQATATAPAKTAPSDTAKSSVQIVDSDGCSITMPTDIPNPEPVYILTTAENATPKLFRPTGQVTTIPIGATLTLYCAGKGNNLELLAQQTLTLTCDANKSFYSAEKSKSYNLNQLNCASIPTSDLQLTSIPCAAGQGYVFEPGFALDTNFVSVFRICYDNSTENTLYSRNIINGATQKFKINESTRRAFRADGMRFTTTATNNLYANKNQIVRFEKLFGADQSYITKTMFLARGHITPDADFIFGYEQLSTYFYANVAPEFQVVNAGNWLRVENLARKLATAYDSDLLTFTGTLGILQLPTAKNELKSIYLDKEELIEAPVWYYKILLHPQLPVDLVMITLNNPFAEPDSVVEFCTNVCDLYGVNSPQFSDVSRGYTFCCTMEDFANAVKGLPTFDVPEGWSFKN